MTPCFSGSYRCPSNRITGPALPWVTPAREIGILDFIGMNQRRYQTWSFGGKWSTYRHERLCAFVHVCVCVRLHVCVCFPSLDATAGGSRSVNSEVKLTHLISGDISGKPTCRTQTRGPKANLHTRWPLLPASMSAPWLRHLTGHEGHWAEF